ncbi:hypothetical protein [Candidatus Neptunochlamydia vexilliferae]|uniref:hypothetical protein n=1 Tax=Candidatus Neptunichlamydia vexilliferae TaxID=1651774 RepID=UPI001890FB08|nr:hypothetical protein [Candidatus Neptunochlamydia vexilliferae]
MSEALKTHSINITGLQLDYYHCIIYKNPSEEKEPSEPFFQRGGAPSDMSSFLIPVPPSPLESWNFCIMGFKRDIIGTPVCKKAVKLQWLISLTSPLKIL